MALAELVQGRAGDGLVARSGGDFRAELQWGAHARGLVLHGENTSYIVGAEP